MLIKKITLLTGLCLGLSWSLSAGATGSSPQEMPNPLSLSRKVAVFSPGEDDKGLKIKLSHDSLLLSPYKKEYGLLSGRLNSHSSEQTMSHHYGFSAYKDRAAKIDSRRRGEGLPTDGLFSRSRELYVRRADTVAVSFLERNILHQGGPSLYGDVHSVYGRNIDTVSGKYLRLSDVFDNLSELSAAVEAQLRRDYPEAPFIGNGDLDVLGLLQAGEKELIDRGGGTFVAEECEGVGTWTLEPRGATFYFNPPGLAAWREGIFCATLLFDEYPELFREKYRLGPAGYAIEMAPGLPVRTILGDGSGAATAIYETAAGPLITCGPQRYQDKPTEDFRGVLVCPAEGGAYLYLDALVPETNIPWHELRVFDLTGEIITQKINRHSTLLSSGFDASQATWHVLTDPDHFLLNTDTPEVASPRPLTRINRVGPDGMPEEIGSLPNS